MLPQAIEACIPVLKAVPKTTRGSPVTKADHRRFSRAHWTQAKPRQPLPAVARIQQWNSGPDPGPAVQNAHQFTKWLRHDLYVAKRPALRSYPASPGWLTSQDFRDNFELISLDGTQRRTFTGPIPNLLRTAQHVQFFPAGVSADGALFAVRWTGVAEGNSRSQSWISIHQASDGKSVYHTENVDRCVCLPKGRVLFYHVDPQSVRGQTKTLSVSIVDIATGETRLERPYDDLEQLYATPGGQQLLVAKELAGGTRLQVYSAEDGSEMSVADYPDVSLGENMALSQDGKEVAIVAQRRLTVIDLSTGRIALSRRVSNVHKVVEWLDDGRFLLLSQNVILERRTGRQLTTLRHQINPRRKLSLYGRWLVPQEVTARYGPPTAIPLPTVRQLADSPTRSQRPKVALRFYGFDHPELLSGTQEALFTGFGLDCAERNKTDDCDAVLSFNYDGERVADGERRQTKLILHGRELPADIPRAGIMNTPAPTNVSVSGSLMSPDMDEFQYKDSKVSTGLLMEEFETVRGECRFSDDLPFDMGLPQQTQIQIVGMMDAIGKLDYPPTEEFQLRPGARQWLRTGLPKSDSTVEPPSQIAGAWSLDSPQILQQAGDDKVRAVVHQMIDGEHGVVGSLTFAMRDEEPIVLAGLEGPCIKEIRLSQEQRELVRVRNGAFAPPFQNSADRRRWFLQSGEMLFVGDTSSDAEPRRHMNFNQALDKSLLTSQGEFLIQLPAQRSKQKELHVHRFDKLLQENGRDGGLPQPERVITEAAYAKYFALPDSDDLLAVEFQAVRRVNVTTGKDVWRSELPESVTSRYETKTTGDGTLGIICRQDREQLLIFVNPESGELGATEPYVPAEPRTYSPDHSMYVTVFEKNYIRICSTATDEELWKTEVGSSNNRMQINTRSCIAWSPDGRYLALGCNSMDRGVRKCAIDVWAVGELAP